MNTSLRVLSAGRTTACDIYVVRWTARECRAPARDRGVGFGPPAKATPCHRREENRGTPLPPDGRGSRWTAGRLCARSLAVPAALYSCPGLADVGAAGSVPRREGVGVVQPR